MGKSVRELAEDVDAALGRLAQARGLEAEAQDALSLAQQDVAKAYADVADARDALFAEHPELAPAPALQIPRPPDGPIPALKGTIVTTNNSAWDPMPVEVDDDHDPRFTGGASVVSPVDGEDLPPVEWEEHEES